MPPPPNISSSSLSILKSDAEKSVQSLRDTLRSIRSSFKTSYNDYCQKFLRHIDDIINNVHESQANGLSELKSLIDAYEDLKEPPCFSLITEAINACTDNARTIFASDASLLTQTLICMPNDKMDANNRIDEYLSHLNKASDLLKGYFESLYNTQDQDDVNQRFIAACQTIIASFEAIDINLNSLNDTHETKNTLIRLLCEVDTKSINISPYQTSMITDMKQGHWDLWEMSGEGEYQLEYNEPLYARNPASCVHEDRIIAIDFGTKSTTAAYIDDRSIKRLICLDADENKAYENPTALEWCDLDAFLKDYHASISRPFTSYDDVRCSHAAIDHLMEANNEDFYRFFLKLKQWAKDKGNMYIKDKHRVYELKHFLSINNQDINPIEIYAYYIGRYINHMRNGIYLDYLLSFPVKYPKEVREKIRLSFEQGIKKSIPKSVLEQKSLQVTLAASEPAAYAISALKEYGFYTETYHNKRTYYGVFDFGGGTTDFDFGIWQGSQDSRYDFELKHFAEGGDIHLGGENLLELLSFEVFKANAATMKQHRCSFVRPVLGFGGDEALIKDTQEARKNAFNLSEILRDFWEGKNDEYEDNIKILLTDDEAQNVAVDLVVDYERLKAILKDKINQGVQSFYHSFKTASAKLEGLDVLHIFLAGNSSRSILVKEAFEAMIDEASQKSNEKLKFILYPPLGTKEAKQKQEELGVPVSYNDDSSSVNCKSGVVFGMLDSRESSKIKVVSEVKLEDEAKFGFYLGENRFDCFKILVDKHDLEVNGDFKELKSYAGDGFELYYTTHERAVSNKLSIHETYRVRVKFDQDYTDAKVLVRACDSQEIICAVMQQEIIYETKPIILKS